MDDTLHFQHSDSVDIVDRQLLVPDYTVDGTPRQNLSLEVEEAKILA
jgi:hypothetical protein